MAIKDVFETNFAKIKQIFIELISKGDHWPTIGSNNFHDFVAHYEIMDEDLDKGMIGVSWASIFSGKRTVGYLSETLWRHEFLEILTRLAV